MKKQARKPLVLVAICLALVLVIGTGIGALILHNAEPGGSLDRWLTMQEAKKLHKEFCEEHGFDPSKPVEVNTYPMAVAPKSSSIEKLFSSSVAVFRGTIASRTGYLVDVYYEGYDWAKSITDFAVCTEITFAVQEVFKGNPAAKDFTAWVDGGETKYLSTTIHGTRTFPIGEEAIFFVTEDGVLHPYSFQIQDDVIPKLPLWSLNPAAHGGTQKNVPVEKIETLLRKLGDNLS